MTVCGSGWCSTAPIPTTGPVLGPGARLRECRDCRRLRALYPDRRSGPRLLLQRVEEAKAVKNRMHLDIEAADIEAEADRLVALGAARVSDRPCSEHGSSWILMADPEGNEFCVCDAGRPATDGAVGGDAAIALARRLLRSAAPAPIRRQGVRRQGDQRPARRGRRRAARRRGRDRVRIRAHLPHLPATVRRLLTVDPAVTGRRLAARRLEVCAIPVEFVGPTVKTFPWTTGRGTPCSARSRCAPSPTWGVPSASSTVCCAPVDSSTSSNTASHPNRPSPNGNTGSHHFNGGSAADATSTGRSTTFTAAGSRSPRCTLITSANRRPPATSTRRRPEGLSPPHGSAMATPTNLTRIGTGGQFAVMSSRFRSARRAGVRKLDQLAGGSSSG